jgi:hypothetical protein
MCGKAVVVSRSTETNSPYQSDKPLTMYIHTFYILPPNNYDYMQLDIDANIYTSHDFVARLQKFGTARCLEHR